MMLATMPCTPVGLPTGWRSLDELASQVLRRGRSLRIKARGGSMTPFLRDGDVICYETVPGRLFLHRVVGRRHARVVTKGDALTSTEVIPLGQILGTVQTIERRGRIRRLDTRTARWANRMVALMSPILSRLLPLGIGVRRVGRALRRG